VRRERRRRSTAPRSVSSVSHVGLQSFIYRELYRLQKLRESWFLRPDAGTTLRNVHKSYPQSVWKGPS
jgi:hypothetical protein